MSKIDVVRKEMMNAMKSGDKERKEALSMLLAALKAKFIDKREDLTEAEENAVVMKEIKQLEETLSTLPEDRVEMIEQTKNRIAVYKEFMPKLMDAEEIHTIVREVLEKLNITQPTAKDKGLIMKNLMPVVNGKADGKLVNQIVGEFIG